VIDQNLENGVEVHATQRKGLLGYDMTSLMVRVGTSALTSDVLAHARTVQDLRRYNGLLGKLRLLVERWRNARGPPLTAARSAVPFRPDRAATSPTWSWASSIS